MRKKIIAVILMLTLTFVFTGCIHAEQHITLQKDGSGSMKVSYRISKDALDTLIAMGGSIGDAGGTVSGYNDLTMDDLKLVTIDGVEYYTAGDTYFFEDISELEILLSEEGDYDNVYITEDTISIGINSDGSSLNYEDIGEDNQGSIIEAVYTFTMPEPIVYTTGELSDDGRIATYFINETTNTDLSTLFVTTSETEAEFQKAREEVKSTNIKLKSSLTSKGKIKLTWKNASGSKLDYYEVFRSTKKSSGYGKKSYFKTSSGKKMSYTNIKVKSGTRYYYKVRGVRLVNGEKVYTSFSNKANRKAK